jgi:hypothetical protein
MFRKLPTLHPLFALCLLLAPCATPQTASDRFDIHGKVINAVTGEPIGGALVQLSDLSQFSQSDGTFTFINLSSRLFPVFVRKPGFFNNQDLGRWNAQNILPAEGDLLIKLTPEGIIFGQVKNEIGEPMERVSVRAQRWQVADGRRQLQFVLDTTTDDEGNFRIAELIPGSYYLSFALPGRRSRIVSKLRRKTQEEDGYGLQFYPGVADFAAARPLEIRAGVQVRVVHTFGRQRLFEISGVVRGASQDNPAQIVLVNSWGESIGRDARLEPKTGQFQIASVPAGTYMLSASSFRRGSDGQPADSPPLTAMLPIHVNSNLDGLIFNLATAPSAMIQLRDEVQGDASPNNFHQVMVRMISREFPQYSPAVVVPASADAPWASAPLQGFAPGTYSVDATPAGTGYIASLRCGSIDLLRDDLTIAPGSAPPPIEVTLRNDGAQLSAALLDSAKPATFVIFSPEYPRRTIFLPNGTGSISLGNLAPGIYQVFALNAGADLEFRNPSAVEPYLKHASSVTLQPGDNTSVRVEMQQFAESQP